MTAGTRCGSGLRGVSDFDWEAARSRIAEAIAAVDSIDAPSETQRRRLLDSRAEELAKPPVVESGTEPVVVIAASVLGTDIGFPIGDIHRVIEVRDLYPWPTLPGVYCGLVLDRGAVLPVIDLSPFLSINPDRNPPFALVAGPEGQVAISVTSIIGVRSFNNTSIATTDPRFATHRSIIGQTTDGLLLCDVRALVNDARLVVEMAPAFASAGGRNGEQQ
ncbi:MAG: chemotaxis protein CheW [Pseudomonadota bacterium]|nr:chemotaxis protein CheW [Pseudomonadota bacterium]